VIKCEISFHERKKEIEQGDKEEEDDDETKLVKRGKEGAQKRATTGGGGGGGKGEIITTPQPTKIVVGGGGGAPPFTPPKGSTPSQITTPLVTNISPARANLVKHSEFRKRISEIESKVDLLQRSADQPGSVIEFLVLPPMFPDGTSGHASRRNFIIGGKTDKGSNLVGKPAVYRDPEAVAKHGLPFHVKYGEASEDPDSSPNLVNSPLSWSTAIMQEIETALGDISCTNNFVYDLRNPQSSDAAVRGYVPSGVFHNSTADTFNWKRMFQLSLHFHPIDTSNAEGQHPDVSVEWMDKMVEEFIVEKMKTAHRRDNPVVVVVPLPFPPDSVDKDSITFHLIEDFFKMAADLPLHIASTTRTQYQNSSGKENPLEYEGLASANIVSVIPLFCRLYSREQKFDIELPKTEDISKNLQKFMTLDKDYFRHSKVYPQLYRFLTDMELDTSCIGATVFNDFFPENTFKMARNKSMQYGQTLTRCAYDNSFKILLEHAYLRGIRFIDSAKKGVQRHTTPSAIAKEMEFRSPGAADKTPKKIITTGDIPPSQLLFGDSPGKEIEIGEQQQNEGASSTVRTSLLDIIRGKQPPPPKKTTTTTNIDSASSIAPPPARVNVPVVIVPSTKVSTPILSAGVTNIVDDIEDTSSSSKLTTPLASSLVVSLSSAPKPVTVATTPEIASSASSNKTTTSTTTTPTTTTTTATTTSSTSSTIAIKQDIFGQNSDYLDFAKFV